MYDDSAYTHLFAFRLEKTLPHLTPATAALAGTSCVVLISGIFSGPRKILFQIFMFGLALVIAVTVLVTDEFVLDTFWAAYIALPDRIKLALAVVSIVSSYFGGAMYISGLTIVTSSESNETPASCDSVVTFDVPNSIAADDKKFFESMLDK